MAQVLGMDGERLMGHSVYSCTLAAYELRGLVQRVDTLHGHLTLCDVRGETPDLMVLPWRVRRAELPGLAPHDVYRDGERWPIPTKKLPQLTPQDREDIAKQNGCTMCRLLDHTAETCAQNTQKRKAEAPAAGLTTSQRLCSALPPPGPAQRPRTARPTKRRRPHPARAQPSAASTSAPPAPPTQLHNPRRRRDSDTDESDKNLSEYEIHDCEDILAPPA